MTNVGISLPGNVEAAAERLVKEIKALDTQVESFKAKLPANAYLAWKLWAKGTVEALVAVLMKSATRAAAVTFPLWPAGAVAAAVTVKADQALDDTFIAGEYAKLATWHETFTKAGAPVVGPIPTAPPGMTLPGGSSTLDTLIKGALILGVVGLGAVVVTSLRR